MGLVSWGGPPPLGPPAGRLCHLHRSHAPQRPRLVAAPSLASSEPGPLKTSEEVADSPKRRRQMSPEHRAKIAAALRSKWEDPTFRAKVVGATTGRVAWNKGAKGQDAWNKGQKLSAETRLRMSEAHTGKRHTKATRRKIALGTQGRRMTEQQREEVSARMLGVPKSPEHRMRIAASQRRKSAASRMLRAIEEYYRALVPSGASAKSRTAMPMGPGGGRGVPRVFAASGKRVRNTFKAEVVDQYMAMLREYKALKEELRPWTAAFQEQNNRKPRLADVERTGIEWLVGKFKHYNVLRERILGGTSSLRRRVDMAKQDPNAVYERANASRGARPTTPNINRLPMPVPSLAADRLAKALSYRRRQGAPPSPSPSPSPSPASDDEGGDDAGAAGARDGGAGSPRGGAGEESDAGHGALDGGRGGAGAGPGPGSRPEREGRWANAALDTKADARVRAAMSKALDYRKEKAQRVAEGAEMAALQAAGRSGGSVGSLGSRTTGGGYPDMGAKGAALQSGALRKSSAVEIVTGKVVASARFPRVPILDDEAPREPEEGTPGMLEVP